MCFFLLYFWFSEPVLQCAWEWIFVLTLLVSIFESSYFPPNWEVFSHCFLKYFSVSFCFLSSLWDYSYTYVRLLDVFHRSLVPFFKIKTFLHLLNLYWSFFRFAKSHICNFQNVVLPIQWTFYFMEYFFLIFLHYIF